jgi:hypothetical protein
VRFLEDPQQFRGPSTLARIDRQISSATALAARIAALDHEVSRAPCCRQQGTLLLSNRLAPWVCAHTDRLARPCCDVGGMRSAIHQQGAHEGPGVDAVA